MKQDQSAWRAKGLWTVCRSHSRTRDDRKLSKREHKTTLPDILKADWVNYAEADEEHIGAAIGKGSQSIVLLLTCHVIQREAIRDSAGKRKRAPNRAK